ncbi:PQQ-like beta-propeller repeat protein [Opitutales bacterium]|nr:PQQ-like beta-propeller repeat protein [Opitutales bacterium]
MTKYLYFFYILLLPFLHSADWPKWLGPNNDGVSTESDWGNDLDNLQWKTKIGVGFSSMVVADGRLFTMGHDGQKRGGKETVYCLNAKTGKPIWTDSYEAPLVDYLHEGGPCATPTVDGDLVYTISKHGKLGAYQAGTGKKVWFKDMMVVSSMKKVPDWGFAASPYVMGNLLLIEAGSTYALDKNSGKIIWKSKDYRPAYGSPISFKSGKDTHIAVIKTDGLVILDGSNGKTLAFEKWETSYSTNASTPIIKGDKIFISTGYRRGCALFQWNGKSLKKIYENKNLSTHMNHAILVDDYLFGFDGNVHMAGPKDFTCIQFSTGKEQWRVADGGLQIGSLLVADDRMILLGQRGECTIAKVNPKKFEVLNREQIIGGKTWTMPVLANGLLYVRNTRGDLFCLGLSK